MMNNNLFDDYIFLVKKIVNKMNYGYIDKDDLYQAGLIGLYKASLKYDSNKNDNYISFCSIYIINEIKNELRENKLIKLNKKIIKIKKYLKDNDSLTINQVANNLNVDEDLVYLASIYQNDVTKINESIDYIESVNFENSDYLSEILMLDETSKNVLILKYYKNYSQSEISKILNCSQAKISRIEKKALSIIRNKLL